MSERAPGFENYTPSRLEWLVVLLNSFIQYINSPLTTIILLTIATLMIVGCEDGKYIADDILQPASEGWVHVETLDLEQPDAIKYVFTGDFIEWSRRAHLYNSASVGRVNWVNARGFYSVDQQGLYFYRWDFTGELVESWKMPQAADGVVLESYIMWMDDDSMIYEVRGGQFGAYRYLFRRDLDTGEEEHLARSEFERRLDIYEWVPRIHIQEFPEITRDPVTAEDPMFHDGHVVFEDGSMWELPYVWLTDRYNLLREGVVFQVNINANDEYIISNIAEHNQVWNRDGTIADTPRFTLHANIEPVYGFGDGKFWFRDESDSATAEFEDPRRPGVMSKYRVLRVHSYQP